MPEKGVLFRPGALGDAILALPAVDLLRRCFPTVSLCWIGYPSHLSWLKEISYLDEYRSIDEALFALLYRPSDTDDELDVFLRRFSFCVAWMNDARGIIRTRLEKIFKDRLLLAPPFPPSGCGIHAADHVWQSVRQWPYAEKRLSGRLPSQAPALFHPGKPGLIRESGLGVIHPGSGGRAKRRPLGDFFSAALALTSIGRRIVWLLGYAEKDLQEEVVDFGRRHNMEVRIDGPLSEIADLLLQAKWYLGNDSGISHLAAFCGTETFIFFGPTLPQEWGAKGSHVHFLYNEARRSDWVPTDAVVKEIASFLERSLP